MVPSAQVDDDSPVALLTLIHKGKSDLACAKVDRILTQAAPDLTQYGDLVNVLLEIPDYERAKRVFAHHRSLTGNELDSDFSLEEIEREEREEIEAERAYATQEPKVFSRAPIWQRGLAITRFSLNPVTSLAIAQDGLAVQKRFGSRKHHRWHEIGSASLDNTRQSHAHGGPYLRRILRIVAGHNSYQINVSPQNADFRHPRVLLAALRKHLNVSERYAGS